MNIYALSGDQRPDSTVWASTSAPRQFTDRRYQNTECFGLSLAYGVIAIVSGICPQAEQCSSGCARSWAGAAFLSDHPTCTMSGVSEARREGATVDACGYAIIVRVLVLDLFSNSFVAGGCAERWHRFLADAGPAFAGFLIFSSVAGSISHICSCAMRRQSSGIRKIS